MKGSTHALKKTPSALAHRASCACPLARHPRGEPARRLVAFVRRRHRKAACTQRSDRLVVLSGHRPTPSISSRNLHVQTGSIGRRAGTASVRPSGATKMQWPTPAWRQPRPRWHATLCNSASAPSRGFCRIATSRFEPLRRLVRDTMIRSEMSPTCRRLAAARYAGSAPASAPAALASSRCGMAAWLLICRDENHAHHLQRRGRHTAGQAPRPSTAARRARAPGSMRVLLDGNIRFSAAKSDGAVRLLLRLLVERGHECWADAYLVAEARHSLQTKGPTPCRRSTRYCRT